VQIPLELEAGIEVLVASLGDRAAEFALKQDKRYGSRVIGRDSFIADELELGIGHTDQLAEILKRIWVEVMQTEVAPVSFGEPEHKRLEARLRGRERRKESHYYVTVPATHTHSPLADHALLACACCRLCHRSASCI
jgi:hypothetical protein